MQCTLVLACGNEPRSATGQSELARDVARKFEQELGRMVDGRMVDARDDGSRLR
jgi:hypothetical protein